jgi:flagellar FliL protein
MAETGYDEFADDDAAERSAEKSGGKKKLLLAVFAIMLLGGGGAGVHFSGILNDDEKTVAQSDQPPAPPPPAKSIYFDLPTMIVNLNSTAAKPHFLKLQASLELEAGFDLTTLLPLRPRVIDKFQVYMRELRVEDLRANGGLNILREELLTQINEAIKPIKVKDVLFRNLLVQ